jgi:stage V sporulation protein R
MLGYNEKDLEMWEKRIVEIVESFGLNPCPQIFEICDHNMMLSYMSYSGMPSRYPHWSYGKSFEKQKTLYNLGMVGLPYEMVINSNPSLAYLMTDNTLLLQILTMAHVYAHNDFFHNNLTFRNTNAEYTLESFRVHADRIRKYEEHPAIGQRAVERVIDSAHALSFNCNRFGALKIERETDREEEEFVQKTHYKPAFGYSEPPGYKVETDEKPTHPRNPEGDLLLFIRDNNPNLAEWQKDILSIVHEETMYFIPQIETKIMNEGWASIWHKRILDKLDLPEELKMEFFVRHNQVVQPVPGSINPYYLGYQIFEDIEKRWTDPTEEEKSSFNRKGGVGNDKIFQVRETDRDESFLRQYLTEDMMRKMDMFQHEKDGDDRIVTKVSNDKQWREIKDTLLTNTGMNSFPVIKIHDANFESPRRLFLKHEFEGRELDQEYTSKTLKHLAALWNSMVVLETVRGGKRVRLISEGDQEKLEKID